MSSSKEEIDWSKHEGKSISIDADCPEVRNLLADNNVPSKIPRGTVRREKTEKQYDFGESAYNRRRKIVRIASGHCHVCNKENIPALSFDTSDGEYGDISICKECFIRLL